MTNSYKCPFESRYASKEMKYIFSADNKFRNWRKLWVLLAKAQQQQGLNITDEQIKELEANKDNINYKEANEKEKEVRHDVMAHIYAYSLQCPNAKGIIHLGATSCYVCDNTDVIIMKQGLEIILKKLVNVINMQKNFAKAYKDLPCLAYTHLQPAQLTTVGKRATLWANEFCMDLHEVEYRLNNLQLLGSKGTTGTQASFVELFDGDDKKIKNIDKYLCKSLGFSGVVPVSGQTYSRKVDSYILNTLSGIAQSASKFSNDLRILQNFKEIEEPFEENQVGSSAMPYKRNPMRSERITALARYMIVDSLNPALTAATQWFERTLDDSANKRLAVAEAFLAIDSILNIMLNISDGLVVYEKVINARVLKELPFMATENIMIEAVKKGGNRQELHERLRVHSISAARVVKEEGKDNDLIERICNDSAFNIDINEMNNILKPINFIGRASEQVDEFILDVVTPILDKYINDLGHKAELTV